MGSSLGVLAPLLTATIVIKEGRRSIMESRTLPPLFSRSLNTNEYHVMTSDWEPPAQRASSTDQSNSGDGDGDGDGGGEGDEPEPRLLRTFLIHNLKLGTLSNPVRRIIIKSAVASDISTPIDLLFTDVVPSDSKIGDKIAASFMTITLPPHRTVHTIHIQQIDPNHVWFTVNDSKGAIFYYPYHHNTDQKLGYSERYTRTDEDSTITPRLFSADSLSYGSVDRSNEKDTTKQAFNVVFLCLREHHPSQIHSISYVPDSFQKTTERRVQGGLDKVAGIEETSEEDGGDGRS